MSFPLPWLVERPEAVTPTGPEAPGFRSCFPFPRSRRSAGFTLVEMVISLGLFLLLLALGLRAWQNFRGRGAENLSTRLLLQMEARRALTNLYREVQEGVEVISPLPGTTLPYLVFKDSLNNIRMVYLEKDAQKTKDEGMDIFRAFMVRRDMAKATPDEPHEIMLHVRKLAFTTYHPGGVLISATLRGGKGDFSLINFVRLQNASSEDVD